MQGEVISVTPDKVVGEVAKIRLDGYRFVTLSCVNLADGLLDILYHFDDNLRLKHLRMTIPRDIPIPSISKVYFAAFLVENEIQDLFGVHFTGLALDYGQTLYLEPEVKVPPFCKYSVTQPDKVEPVSEPASEKET